MVQPKQRGGAARWSSPADDVRTRHLGCEMVDESRGVSSFRVNDYRRRGVIIIEVI